MAKPIKSVNQERVEKIIGEVSSWNETPHRFIFRPIKCKYKDITLAELNALSIEFNTDNINFNVGYSGEQGYSEWTPSSPGSLGYIEVKL
jgi:hypothetical protein